MAVTLDTQRNAPIYNIKAVAHLTGIPADTLRRWESRYNVIIPQRTESGYRLYSQRDVDTINWLKQRLDEGMAISRACEMLRQMGGDPGARKADGASPANAASTAILVPQAGSQTATPQVSHGLRSFEALRADLLEAFTHVDEVSASTLLNEALSLYSVEDVCMQILQPVMVSIGDRWMEGEVSVAVEHFASSFIRTRLSNLFHSSPYNMYGPLVLVGCAPEELHELGPMFLAVFLRRAGYRVVYLGQNVPLESLQGMVQALQPDAVCISATRAETAASLYNLREFLDEYERKTGRAPLLSYGGRVFNRFPHIVQRLGGLYLGEDATEAVRRLGEKLRDVGSR